MITLNYRDAKPIYEQIKDGIRKLIVTNSLMANEKLPSVRELASKLAINPNTISRAYRDLEKEGYIYTLNGKGTFVSSEKIVQEHRRVELFHEFDEIVGELLHLSVESKDISERMERIVKGV